MCGLSSDHGHYPYMYLVSMLFKSSCIIQFNPTSHSFVFTCYICMLTLLRIGQINCNYARGQILFKLTVKAT